jgi:cytochrome c553
MRRWRIAAGLVAGFILCGAAAPSNDPPPDWAFVIFHKTDDATPPPKLVTVPGSKLTVTLKASDDRFAVPDWFPQEHAKPPAVVLHGRAPDLWACSYCHRTTGTGGPENAVIAGLPTAYIEEQFAEFSSGRRHCAVPAVRPCGTTMNAVARTANAEDIKQAAAYYSRLPYRSRIKVVEAAIVPKTEINHFTLARSKAGGTEPIGHRILELPDDPTRFENGDWHATFTAYVPPGSIARGRELVQMGTGALPCASCHGAGLQGAGAVPPLAGRSPSYIVRQLYDIQYGFRGGPVVVPMQPEVAHLTADDRIAIAAYLAALGG